jgi:shikimate kinase
MLVLNYGKFTSNRRIGQVTIAMTNRSTPAPVSAKAPGEALAHRLGRSVVLVGLMGSGKSCIGKRLATHMGLPFVDADREIEAAAGCSIPEIFERHGERAFRDGERRVIQRLLANPPHVLATGGGAFMDEATRAMIRERGVSVWLRADVELLLKRVGRRNDRPLLQGVDPRAKLLELMRTRNPVYAEADLSVDSADGPPDLTLQRVVAALEARFPAAGPAAAGT